MKTIDTTEGQLVKRSVQLAWPAVLQAVLINFYPFNDFLFVGMLDNAAATAALSSCFAVLIIHYMLLRLVASGGTTLIAQLTGAKRTEGVAATMRESLVASVLWSMLVGGLLYANLDTVVALNNATAAVDEHIAAYLRVIALGTPAFALMLVVDGAFRARGNTRVPLVLEGFSLVLNAALNWLLVLGNLGVDPMGVEGAAIATMVSRAVPGIIGLTLVWMGHLGFRLKAPVGQWRPTWSRVRKMLAIGFFDSAGGIVYGLVYLVLNRIAGQLGPAAQGGLGAGLRGIEWIAFAFGDGFMVAAVTIVGQNVGAGRTDRALRGAWVVAGMSAASCQLVGVSFLLAPELLCSLVTTDAATLRYATDYVFLIGWFMWAVGVEMAFYGAFIGAGRPAVTVTVSSTANLLRIPLACGFVFGADWVVSGTLWGIFGVGAAPPTAGNFIGIGWAIALTAVCKALFYLVFVGVRGRVH